MFASKLNGSLNSANQNLHFKSNEQTTANTATKDPFGATINLETEQKLEKTDNLGDTELKQIYTKIDDLMKGPRNDEKDKEIKTNFKRLPLEKQIKVYTEKFLNTQTDNSNTFPTGRYFSNELNYSLLQEMQNDAYNLKKTDPNKYQDIIKANPNCGICNTIQTFINNQLLQSQQGKSSAFGLSPSKSSTSTNQPPVKATNNAFRAIEIKLEEKQEKQKVETNNFVNFKIKETDTDSNHSIGPILEPIIMENFINNFSKNPTLFLANLTEHFDHFGQELSHFPEAIELYKKLKEVVSVYNSPFVVNDHLFNNITESIQQQAQAFKNANPIQYNKIIGALPTDITNSLPLKA